MRRIADGHVPPVTQVHRPAASTHANDSHLSAAAQERIRIAVQAALECSAAHAEAIARGNRATVR